MDCIIVGEADGLEENGKTKVQIKSKLAVQLVIEFVEVFSIRIKFKIEECNHWYPFYLIPLNYR
jgi:hypothetical protein